MLALNRFVPSPATCCSVGRTGPLRLVFGLLASGLTGSGCSFLFVNGPPDAHKTMPYFDCTSSKVAPTVDAVLGAIYGIQGAVFIVDAASSGSSSGLSNGPSSGTTAGAVALGLGALFVTSAVSGYGKTSDCREAQAKMLERANRNPGGFAPATPGFAPGMPAPYQPPVQPYDPWAPPPSAASGAPPDTAPPGATPPPGAPPSPPAGTPAPSPPAGTPPPSAAPAPTPKAKSPAPADVEAPSR